MTKSKKLLSIIGLIAVFMVAVFFIFQSSTINNSTPALNEGISDETVSGEKLPEKIVIGPVNVKPKSISEYGNKNFAQISEEESERNTEAAKVSEKQIQALIKEFNQHLSDPLQRKEIEEKLATLSPQYKEIILKITKEKLLTDH